MYLFKYSNKIAIYLLLYISLLVGFYFDENSSGGSLIDFETREDLINLFKANYLDTFLNYDNFNDRHSPILIMLIAALNLLGLDLDFIRFLHLNLLPLLIFISYKCLLIKFPHNDKNLIFLICCVFFLCPSLRSIAIWPDSRLFGLILFLFSIFYFFRFKKQLLFKYCIYNNFFLILSSYLSPNFSLFFLYFLAYYFQYFGFSKKLMMMFLINFILSLPMFYYLFILDVNFMSTVAVANIDIFTRINPFNKILMISSLIFFYIIPIIFNNSFKNCIDNHFKLNQIFYTLILLIFSIFFFDYSTEFTGGGIFFRLSHFLFDNNYLFFIITYISILLILIIFKLNFNNILLFIILILSNPQLTIYHKYFDPLLILLFLLTFDFNFSKEKIINKKLLSNFYFLLSSAFSKFW